MALQVANYKQLSAEEHEGNMLLAYQEARQGCKDEQGCPIGSVIVDPATKTVVGKGHNMLVQEGNPLLHGEMSAMRSLGRVPSRRHLVMYTTLQPCWMCTGTILQFAIPTVVVADATNAGSDETMVFLRSKGVEVVVMDPKTSEAAAKCIALCAEFKEEKPDLWLEDWGGPRLPAKAE